MEEVKLFGAWPSPFSYRVIWALKLKGIAYQYVEEDLSNKSTSLLEYNPVHKKIPVLVHCGKPICESMLIIQYIEETWPHVNPLLPTDPYDRAMARFWVKFAEDNTGPTIRTMFLTTGKEFEKAKKDSLEMLRTIEDHAPKDKKFFGGERIGMVDLAFGAIPHWTEVIEEVLGVKILEPGSFPCLHAWIKNFKEVPVVKENLPDRNEMLAYFKHRREVILASP
ncbi:glutathione transferase GST 23-like [Actinidia eriantha]|uniref:glutathione transferase GST 23-like n=1 Tax=Actinidia eriantha TaxID=165200 RepID=UPI002582BD33|nr:glutathione transferase GST 23-like [Actinidia eriantha]